jgi:hypothetical protein
MFKGAGDMDIGKIIGFVIIVVSLSLPNVHSGYALTESKTGGDRGQTGKVEENRLHDYDRAPPQSSPRVGLAPNTDRISPYAQGYRVESY